jgi:hypothetical protein
MGSAVSEGSSGSTEAPASSVNTAADRTSPEGPLRLAFRGEPSAVSSTQSTVDWAAPANLAVREML